MRYLGVFSLLLMFSGCNNDSKILDDFNKAYESDKLVLKESINMISSHKIVFGHQSVGNDILSGIKNLEEESGKSLTHITTREVDFSMDSIFIDFFVGSNSEPKGKIDDFVNVVKELGENESCTAIFKLCFVDITENSNIDELLDYYTERLYEVKQQRPNVNFILFTVPITGVQTGWKVAVKKLFGSQPNGYMDNISRQKFNENLINELAAEFKIFDLAYVESTLPDGSWSSFKYKGERYYCLPQIYKRGNGHLNDMGSKHVAINLLEFLSEKVQ